MNSDMIAQITRLVIEKLKESENSPSLSSAEIKRWNEISASMQRTAGHSGNTTNDPLQALSDAEIKNWNEITERINNRGHQAAESATQVKLYTNR